jgi:hypothetical protein
VKVVACAAQVVFAVSALALFVPVIFNQTAREEHEALEDAPGASLATPAHLNRLSHPQVSFSGYPALPDLQRADMSLGI